MHGSYWGETHAGVSPSIKETEGGSWLADLGVMRRETVSILLWACTLFRKCCN